MIEATTPLMRQYQSIKKRYPHALLLFRLGDFYELFYEDAIVASRGAANHAHLPQSRTRRTHPHVRRPLSRRGNLYRPAAARRLQNRHLRSDGAARPRQTPGAPRSRPRHHSRHRHRPQRPRTQGEQFPGRRRSRRRGLPHRPGLSSISPPANSAPPNLPVPSAEEKLHDELQLLRPRELLLAAPAGPVRAAYAQPVQRNRERRAAGRRNAPRGMDLPLRLWRAPALASIRRRTASKASAWPATRKPSARPARCCTTCAKLRLKPTKGGR